MKNEAPALGRGLSRSKIRKALERGGRRRYLDERSTKIFEGLRTPQLQAPDLVAKAFGSTVVSTAAVIASMNAEIARLQEELAGRFEEHPGRHRLDPGQCDDPSRGTGA